MMRRQLNSLVSVLSWWFSNITGKPVVSGMPPALGIEITNRCNLKCPECACGAGLLNRQQGFISEELFTQVIDEAAPYLVNLNLYFQGEPMLHPAFFKLAEKARGIRTTLSTNGHFLGGDNARLLAISGINKIIVSLDGFDQETYSIYRTGGDFEKVRDGIIRLSEEIKKMRSGQKLEIQFLVSKYNQHQVDAVKQFAEDNDAALVLKSMQILDMHGNGGWLPDDGKYKRYREEGGSLVIKGKLPDRCLRLWMNPVVTWDGNVVPCCFDKDAEYSFGNVNDNSLREIWNGKKSLEFRRRLLHDRKSIPMCRNCTSGLKGVKY